MLPWCDRRLVRPRMARHRIIRAALLLAVVLAVCAATAPPSATTTALAPSSASATEPATVGDCTHGWRRLAIPAAARAAIPFGLVSADGAPAWLVGGSRSGYLLVEWDGQRWRDAGVHSGGTRGLLAGASRGPELLGVGYFRRGGVGLWPVAGRVVAQRWTEERLPDMPGDRATLTDIVALSSGQALAVGTAFDRGRMQAFALRRTTSGAWWRTARVTRGQSGYTAAARAVGGEVWAVGWSEGAKGRWRPLVAAYSAAGQRRVRGVRLPAGSAVLTDIAFDRRGEGWVVGHLVPAGSSLHSPVLLRWDGAAWSTEALPWAAETSAVLRAVAVGSGDSLWLAGTRLADDGRESVGFVARRTAGAWSVRDLEVPSDARSELRSIATTRDGAMVTATLDSAGAVLESCPQQDTSDQPPVTVAARPGRRTAEAVEGRYVSGGRGLVAARPIGSLTHLPKAVRATGFRVRDVTSKAGLESWTPSYGGLVADLDGDGWSDVFYSRHARLPSLLMGGPDGFAPAPEGAFSDVDRHGCDTADVDGDGALDVFCAVGRARGTSLDRHELSLRAGRDDGQLVRGALGASDPFGRGRRAAFLRLDDDDYPELFITTTPDRVDGMPSANRLFRNVGGVFVAAPELGLDRPVGGACAIAADADGDGDDDLLLCVVEPEDGRLAGLRLYRNEDGLLRERSRALGVVPIGDVDALVTDMTGDGHPDLVQLARGRLRVSRGTERGFVPIFDARLSHAVALAAGDVNGDGLADLYIVRGGRRNWPDLLLVNGDRARAFVSVRIPQATGGSGDDVMALDHDGNGLVDFLVLNGRPRPGPVQLLASYPDR